MGKYDLRINGELEKEIQKLIELKVLGNKSDVLRILLENGLNNFYDNLLEITFQKTMEEPFIGPDLKVYYPKLFDKSIPVIQLVYLRDNCCRKCGNTNADELGLHAIDGDRMNVTLDNIIRLCYDCCGKIEDFNRRNAERKLFIEWFLKDNLIEDIRIKTAIERYRKREKVTET